MATRKAAPLDGGLVTSKGQASPAQTPTPTPPKDTIAVTVRLPPDLYIRLKKHGVGFRPRKTNQELIVRAITDYLDDSDAED